MVPKPSLLSPPAPPLFEMIPSYVRVVPVSVSKVPTPPPPLPTAIPRLALKVRLAVLRSVPPSTTSRLGVGAPGAAPRLFAALMLSTPPLIVVGPVNVLAPPSTRTPPPVLVSPKPVPEITPLRLSTPELVTFTPRVALSRRSSPIICVTRPVLFTMSPPSVIWLPERLNAPAVEVNWMPPKLVPMAKLLTGVSRLMPSKISTSPGLGATSPTQLAPLVTELLAPPPCQVRSTASASDEVASTAAAESAARARTARMLRLVRLELRIVGLDKVTQSWAAPIAPPRAKDDMQSFSELMQKSPLRLF